MTAGYGAAAMKQKPEGTCATCTIIRWFLLGGTPLLLLLFSGGELTALRGLPLTDMAALGFGIAFVVVVGWKAWDEYWRK